MQRHSDYTRNQLAQVGASIKALIYSQRHPLDELLVSGPTDRITYSQAQELGGWRQAKLGDQFGPSWATYWFRAKVTIPPEWAGRRVDLQWITHSEGTLWVNGRSIQGLNWNQGDRPDAILTDQARAGQTLAFQIEMACNGKFGVSTGAGTPAKGAFEHVSPFVLDRAEIALFDAEAWQLFYDFYVLQQLEKSLAEDGDTITRTFGGELLSELNRFANTFDADDRSSWKAGRAILKQLYQRKNGSVVHELSAIGHAHIDTAWLWPVAETDRKCIRTFSSQTAYMEAYPAYRFACSQAYQYARVKQLNPDLYERMKARVAKGQFVVVGGTWIEPDCNIPSGESLCRQFLLGQRFFEQEFGQRCTEFWNPDVFGYNGQLPQIMKLAGIQRFLTQKLSWNWLNKPRHHTFTWQGIDGSEVLAHFPPANTYNATAEVAELRMNARDYKDHDRGHHSLMLFGFGDGGGGPTKHMLEILSRAQDLEGLPRTHFRSSEEFFTLLEKDVTDRPLMIGELYFELHRGTYTSQAATKRGNRKGEFLLHDVEFLSAIAHKEKGLAYPSTELQHLWEVMCLNQFHDILPGSSITEVYDDAERDYAEIAETAGALRERAAMALVGAKAGKDVVPLNTIGFARAEVATLPDGTLAYVTAPSYGFGRVETAADQVTVRHDGGNVVLENSRLRAELTEAGALVSLIEKTTGRETMAGGGDFKLYDDRPTLWDAWDIEPQAQETEKDLPQAESMTISAKGGLRGEVLFNRKVGRSSSLTQRVRLDAGARRLEFHIEVDWHESQKMLKAAFPVNVRAMNASYEMQFGDVERPTHFNTTFDLARFEVPGHKWSDLSEHGFGVALLSESKYGFSTFGNVMRITLLRAPKSPDPSADMGRQGFAYALMPHASGWREAGVVAEGCRFNAPMLFVAGSAAPQSFASVDDANLVLDTIKKAEDSDSLVLRLYECHGARGVAKVKVEWAVKSASFCNVLEDEQGRATINTDGTINVPYTPHQIITLKTM